MQLGKKKSIPKMSVGKLRVKRKGEREGEDALPTISLDLHAWRRD